jgi:hypothetical protein
MNLDFIKKNNDLTKYWNNEVIQFPNQPEITAFLPDASVLMKFITGNFEAGTWGSPIGVNINASTVLQDGSHQQLLGIDINTARNCYSKGFSLCFGDMTGSIDQLALLKSNAVEIFKHPELIAVTGYLSPEKAIGVLHFDRQHNFFIQREGSKRWTVSERAAVKNPHENLLYPGVTQSLLDQMKSLGYEISIPRDCGRKIYDLNPGDVLYIPPGFYHSPETLSDHSLHYTLTVEPACFWKDFNQKMFLKLLASQGKFLADYRFMTDDQRSDLFRSCMSEVILSSKNF